MNAIPSKSTARLSARGCGPCPVGAHGTSDGEVVGQVDSAAGARAGTGLPRAATLSGAILAAAALMSVVAPSTNVQASDLVLEEITVQAQRRTENLQDVPIQVAAFTAEAIEDIGIRNSADFIGLVPNVSLDESFTYLNSYVVVRGVTQINNADSPVAVVVDGVPQNNQKQLQMNLFDVQSIEVLKGPQGGLYGRNAIGGAINIVTAPPSQEVGGFAGIAYGRGDLFESSAAISGPLADNAAVRLAGTYKRSDGLIENTYTGKPVDFVDHDWELRGKLALVASENLQVDLRGSYRDFSAGGVIDSVVDSGNSNDFRRPRSNLQGLTYGHLADGSLKLDYELGDATLTAISGYTRITENYRGDLDFSNPIDNPGGFNNLGFHAGQGQDLDVTLKSQELRLVSSDEQRLRWIAGAYYVRTDRALRTRGFLDLDGTLEQIDNPALLFIDTREDNANDAYAVYGQLDYDLTDKLTLSGALRYDRDEREQTNLATGAVRSKTFDAVQPKATLTYKIDPRRLVYATYSTGFRSGGFNAPEVFIPVFDEETLTNYEVGFKTGWLNQRLLLNGALYYARDKDFQYFFVDVSTAAQIIGNIDRVDIKGVELELQALLGQGLKLYAGLGTTDSEIKKNTLAPATVGNKTPKTSEWTLNAGGQYDYPLPNGADLVLRLDYQHRGKKYWQVDNLNVQDPVDIVDLRLGYQAERWSVFLSARNLLDEKYYGDYNPSEYSGLIYDLGSRGQPATYGVEARVRF